MTSGSSGFSHLLFFLLSVIIPYRSGSFVHGLPYGGGGLRQFDAIVVDAPSSSVPAASPVGPVIVSNPVVDTPLHDCPYRGYYYTPSSYSSSTYTTRQQPTQQQQQYYYYQPSSYYQQQATRDDGNYYNSYQSNYYYRAPSTNTLSSSSQYYARNSNYQYYVDEPTSYASFTVQQGDRMVMGYRQMRTEDMDD